MPLALGAAVLFGLSAPLAKLLLSAFDPQMLAGLLYLGAGVGLAAVHAGRAALGLPAPEAPLRRADLSRLAAVVLAGSLVGPLLLNLESLVTMDLAWVAFGENVDHRLLLGAASILARAVALSWSGSGVRLDLGAALVAVTLLHEPLTVERLLAGLLMGVGLYPHLAERHVHDHTHEAMAHEHAHVHDTHHQHAHGPDDPPGEPHTHPHRHGPLRHTHAHYPDLHHRYGHGEAA